MGLNTEEKVVIVLCCVIFAVAVLVLIVFVWRRYNYYSTDVTIVEGGGDRRMGHYYSGQPLATMSKPPGRYVSPLTLEIYPSAPRQCDIYVKIVHESSGDAYQHYFNGRHHFGGGGATNASVMTARGTNGFGYGGHNGGALAAAEAAAAYAADEVIKDQLMGYLLYTQPLQLVRSGSYIVRVHCLCRGDEAEGLEDISDVRQYHYTVVREGEGHSVTFVEDEPAPPAMPYSPRGGLPIAPPRIIPDSGEVTDITPIKIVLSGGANGPLAADMSVFSNAGNGGGAEHILYSTDNSFPSVMYTGPFTLSIPRGQLSARYTVRAVATDGARASEVTAATLEVLQHSAVAYDPSIPAPTAQVEAIGAMLYFENPLEHEAVIEYQLEYEGERAYLPDGTPAPSPLLAADGGGVGFGAAEEDPYGGISGRERLLYQGRSIEIVREVRRIYAWTVPKGGGGGRGERLKESRPAIYDVSLQRLVPHPRAHKNSARRCTAPVMCVQCSDLFLAFDEPPALYRLLYTLDGSEPSVADDAFSTRRYHAGAQPIDISKCAEGSVTVTARYFTRPDDRGLTRFGDRFSRGFHGV